MQHKGNNLPALRHVLYRELLSLLPPASIAQTVDFIANLALCRNQFKMSDPAAVRDRAMNNALSLLMPLKVSPDIATATNYRKYSRTEIEQIIECKFGNRLADVAGFYKTSRWRVNLPENCALFGYMSRLKFYTGILCQPVDRIDMYFLLSSAKHGGPKAIRLEENDRDFFERFKEPYIGRPSPFKEPLDLTGWKIVGEGKRVRFIEPKRSDKAA
ncbi:MAG: hypothetical protein ABIU09_02770 [Pyrinomonadaceae bacterium]